MKRLIVAWLAVVALATGPAMAADMRVKAPLLKAPPPAYSWTGFYIGGSLGGLWDRVDGSFVNPPPAIFSTNQSTGIADAHVGAQYQFAPASIVLGIEGDFVALFSNRAGTDTCHPPASCAPGSTLAGNIVNNIWTVGGRAGWALNVWLPYVSGGYAATRMNEQLLNAAGVLFESSQTNDGGYYFGVGADWRIWQNLVAGLEYRHYEFNSVTATPILAATGLPNVRDTYTLNPHADTFEARLSWLFNPSGPRMK
jgi:outer membrane immunogenic protein